MFRQLLEKMDTIRKSWWHNRHTCLDYEMNRKKHTRTEARAGRTMANNVSNFFFNKTKENTLPTRLHRTHCDSLSAKPCGLKNILVSFFLSFFQKITRLRMYILQFCKMFVKNISSMDSHNGKTTSHQQHGQPQRQDNITSAAWTATTARQHHISSMDSLNGKTNK